MKRFLLFFGETHYPQGGWDDLRSEHETVESACRAVRRHQLRPYDSFWWQVVDARTRQIVASGLLPVLKPTKHEPREPEAAADGPGNAAWWRKAAAVGNTPPERVSGPREVTE